MQVPFGNSFHSLVQWCAWAEQSTGTVQLQVSCDVVFTQKWLPVKGIISTSSIEVNLGMHPTRPASTHLAVSEEVPYRNNAGQDQPSAVLRQTSELQTTARPPPG